MAGTVGPVAANERQASIDRLQGSWRWGRLFAAVWLVYLVPTAMDAWDNPNRALGVLGLVALAAFSAVYLRSFWTIRRLRRSLRMPSMRWRVGVLAAGAALIVVMVLIAGQSALNMCTFLVVITLFILPTRPGVITALAMLAAVAALPYLVPGWTPDLGPAIGLFTAGLIVLSVTQLIQRNALLDQRNAQLAQARSELAVLAVAEERARFSRDLHDILGHSLTVLAVKAELAGRLVRIDAEQAEREIAEVERLARDALADVRAAVAGYREGTLAGELISARLLLDAADIEADLPGAVDHVPGERHELFGWAVREGVTNVVRHSAARTCRVVVDPDAVEITDDGRGPVPAPDGQPGTEGRHGGHGLAGLRERAEALGASLTVGRSAEGGFRLRVGW